MKLASIRDGIHRTEDGVAGLVLLVMAAIPILEIGLRGEELHDACKNATSDEEIKALSEELFALNADQIWFIGVVGLLPHIGVVKNNFRNVPDFGLVASWSFGFPGSADPEQFFIRQE